tara:strand:- start:289 stop:945 length:657 start_codon:yes stop_codon:yes gene_type:complete
LNNSSDFKIIENELKLISYNYYISVLFVNYEFRKKILLILFLDVEFKNIITSNVEENIIATKLNWWKITCSEAIDGKYFSVPALRLLSKYFLDNNIIKNEILSIINLNQKYSLEKNLNKRIKIYTKYLILKKSIICRILGINHFDSSIKISLNYLMLSKSFFEHGENSKSLSFFYKSKSICKRPKRKYLIFFLLNSNNNFTKRNILKKLFLLLFRIWY